MKLTPRNYYTEKNKYLSNSKLNDWFFDKQYFYYKWIINKIPREEMTKALTIGKAVDCYIFDGVKKFKRKFKPVERRDLKNPPSRYTEMTINDFEQALEMGETIRKQSCFKILQSFSYQTILQVNYDLQYFKGLCGIPDWFKVIGDKAFIVDLKTSSTINPNKYHYHCLEYGYYNQQAFYQILLQLINPKIVNFESRHLTLAKNDNKNFYTCEMFKLDQDIIDERKELIKQEFEKIKEEKDWFPKDANWNDPILIGFQGGDI